MNTLSLHSYAPPPPSAFLSPVDTAILQVIRNARGIYRAGLSAANIRRFTVFLPITVFAPAFGAALPTLHGVRRSIARLRRAGLVTRSNRPETPYLWRSSHA